MLCFWKIHSARPSPLPSCFGAGVPERLSAGACPATLRVHVAALSACHDLIDWDPVKKHPLVTHFICEAKWLRPPGRVIVPSWDILCSAWGSGWDFEQLELATVKLLTVKIVFLMAITSLKKIGDFRHPAKILPLDYFAPSLWLSSWSSILDHASSPSWSLLSSAIHYARSGKTSLTVSSPCPSDLCPLR